VNEGSFLKISNTAALRKRKYPSRPMMKPRYVIIWPFAVIYQRVGLALNVTLMEVSKIHS